MQGGAQRRCRLELLEGMYAGGALQQLGNMHLPGQELQVVTKQVTEESHFKDWHTEGQEPATVPM